MKHFTCFIFILVSFQAFAQTREEIIEEFRRERAKMFQEIQKMFDEDLTDMGMGKGFFDDDDFDSFFGASSFSGGGNNVKVEQEYAPDGTMTVTIIPKNKNVNLDIQTTDNMITIKSETKIEQTDQSESGTSKSFSSSSFSRSVQIPSGYKAMPPKQEGESIKIVLAPQKKIKSAIRPIKQKKKSDKVPIGKRPGEDTL